MDPHSRKKNPHFDAITIGGTLLGPMLAIGLLWFMAWLVDTYPLAVLLFVVVILPGWLLVGFTAFLVSLFVNRQ